MILCIGIGNDIINIHRFKNWNIKKFKKFFTVSEQKYIKNIYNAAGIFAAKEAIIKALYNINITKYNIFDIEIKHNNYGVPNLYSPIFIDFQVMISISHCTCYANATALIYKKCR